MSASWDPDFIDRSPMFAPLRAASASLRGPVWPDCRALNRCLSAVRAPVLNATGAAISFVPQQPGPARFEDRYEPRIFLRGEVALRPANWHDFFNALVWLTFPRAKAALNERHYHELEGRRAARALNRGAVEDALTLFDEGGIVVLTSDPALSALIAEFQWKQLFWNERSRLLEHMRFHVFGHGLYEKAMQPFSGMTGRGVVFEVEHAVLGLPVREQLAEIDLRLRDRLRGNAQFRSTRELVVVPVLGVPGWCEGNRRAEYYDDPNYFRSGRNLRLRGRLRQQ